MKTASRIMVKALTVRAITKTDVTDYWPVYRKVGSVVDEWSSGRPLLRWNKTWPPRCSRCTSPPGRGWFWLATPPTLPCSSQATETFNTMTWTCDEWFAPEKWRAKKLPLLSHTN